MIAGKHNAATCQSFLQPADPIVGANDFRMLRTEIDGEFRKVRTIAGKIIGERDIFRIGAKLQYDSSTLRRCSQRPAKRIDPPVQLLKPSLAVRNFKLEIRIVGNDLVILCVRLQPAFTLQFGNRLAGIVDLDLIGVDGTDHRPLTAHNLVIA